MPSSYTYDAENRLSTTAGVPYTGACPERSRGNADGKRVKKSNGKLYWPGVGLDAVTESDLNGNITAEYVFFNGRRIAMTELGAVPNSGFESGSAGWNMGYGTSIVTNPSAAHSGDKYLQLSTSGPWSGALSNPPWRWLPARYCAMVAGFIGSRATAR